MPKTNRKNNNITKKLVELRFIPLISGLIILFATIAVFIYIKTSSRYLNNSEEQPLIQDLYAPFIDQSENSIPDIFPKDFPVIDGAVFINSYVKENESMTAVSVLWETEKNMNDIKNFYKDALNSKNWLSEITYGDNSFTATLSKANHEGFMGVAQNEKGDKNISVTLIKRK